MERFVFDVVTLLAQAMPDHITSGQVSVGLLVFMQLQIANLQVKVNSLMNPHKRKK